MLGEDALISWLTSEPGIKVHDIEQKIEAFRGTAEQLDDITLVSYTCQNLDELQPEHTLCHVPFTICVDLKAQQLREVDPVHELITMVSSQSGMQGIRSDLSTVLSELFNNALDHGLLKLDSELKKSTDGFFEYFEMRMARLSDLQEGHVNVNIRFFPDAKTLHVTVKDSGQGFDYQNRVQAKDSECFGRGIPLIKELSNKVEFSEGGTRVDVTFDVS